MIQPKLIDDIARRLGQALPPGVRELQQEVENNVRAGLQSAFSRLDLVTREEFEVQQAVLARTRARLEALERQVAELEVRLSDRRNGRPDAREPATDDGAADR